MNQSLDLPRRGRGFAYAAGLTLAGAVAFTGLHAARSASVQPPVAVQVDPHPVNRGALETASYAGVAKRVAPSVVKITVTSHRHDDGQAGMDSRQFQQMDPFFRQFFGQSGQAPDQDQDQDQRQGHGRRPQARQPEEMGLGSGVIISPDGYIVTNNHVVDGAETVTVSLDDGRELKAKVVGRDPQTDLAVVKVDAKDLPAITFAPSANVEVGDRVLAIGNPFGIGETVTSGIVSMKDQRSPELGGLADYEDFIQTDAAINPGNSGGALVDVDGRLIGINTAILTHSGGFQGVGLAIPSDMVRSVANSLVQNGKVVRGYLGVSIQNLNPELAENFGIGVHAGALVTDVQPNTPAARAGLRSGDVITKAGDVSVTDADQLKLAVSETAPGTRIDLKVLRDGATKDVTATTGTMPSHRLAGEPDNSSGSVADSNDTGVLNGVAVADLDSDARQQFDIHDTRIHGAVITSVAADSASARAGLEAGDVIVEINHHAVATADEAVKLSSDGTKKKTLLKLWSHGGMIYTVVDETPSGNS
jgi:serine protease Do